MPENAVRQSCNQKFKSYKYCFFDIIGNVFKIFYDIIQINLQVKRKEGHLGYPQDDSECT